MVAQSHEWRWLTGRCAGALLSVAAACVPTSSLAFVVTSTGKPDEYLKWGPSQLAGTPGGVVTWGFVAAGTPGSDACRHYCPGNSLGELPNFYAAPALHNRKTPLALEDLRSTFQAAFDAWSAVANVQFRYLGLDTSMKPINDPSATSPMIRIGIYAFDGLWAHCMAGAAFSAPPNAGSIAGDIFLNVNVGFQRSFAEADSEVQHFPAGNGLHMMDLSLLALHEVGHAIGLGDSAEPDSVLCSGDAPSASVRRQLLWRKPRADDVAGAQFLYGPPTTRASGSSRP